MSVLDRIGRRIENICTMPTLYGIDTADFMRVERGTTFTSAMLKIESTLAVGVNETGCKPIGYARNKRWAVLVI